MAEEVVWRGGPSPLSLLWHWFFGLFFWAFGAGLAVVLLALGVDLLWAALGLIVCLGLGFLVILSGLLGLVVWRYQITSERVKVVRGLVSRTIREADLEKIQDVAVQQHFWARILNYGTLSFNTAGSDSYEISFRDVNNPIVVKEKFREVKKTVKSVSSV